VKGGWIVFRDLMDRERENGDVTDDSFGNWGGGGIVRYFGCAMVHWYVSMLLTRWSKY